MRKTRNMSKSDWREACLLFLHCLSSHHKDQPSIYKRASCFHCCKNFYRADVKEWIDNGKTALCPKCGIDSVVFGKKTMGRAIMKAMNLRWFRAHPSGRNGG